MVGAAGVVAGALLCPHGESRMPEAGSNVTLAFGEQRTTVYVDGGRGTMGLCLRCKAALADLVKRDAGLAEVVRVVLGLGYTRGDAAKFHSDMRRGWARLGRRVQNWVAVRRLPAQEVAA